MHRPLVVFTHGGGRLGNQLLNFGHLIAWAEEGAHEFDIMSMAFWPYADHFVGTATNLLCFYPAPEGTPPVPWRGARAVDGVLRVRGRNRGLRSLRRTLQFLLRGHAVQYDSRHPLPLDPALSHQFQEHDVVFLSGWGWRNWSLFRRHQHAIRTFLTPAVKHQQIAVPFIEGLRGHYDKLIGILIRQDDYRLGNNVTYLFESDIYAEWMRMAAQLFAPQRVGFVIASDEVQDEQRFNGINYHMATGAMGQRGHYLESLLELSLCDLIMTPPSTFGVWAAFMADKPILPLVHSDQILDETMILSNHIFDALEDEHLTFSVK